MKKNLKNFALSTILVLLMTTSGRADSNSSQKKLEKNVAAEDYSKLRRYIREDEEIRGSLEKAKNATSQESHFCNKESTALMPFNTTKKCTSKKVENLKSYIQFLSEAKKQAAELKTSLENALEDADEKFYSLKMEKLARMGPVTCPVNLRNKSKSAEGYVKTPGIGSHKIYTDAKNWTDAMKTCERDDGYLAVIDSYREANLLQEMLSTFQHKRSHFNGWIGMHDAFQNGEYVDIFGKTIDTAVFSSFDGVQLQDSTDKTCVSLFLNTSEPYDNIEMAGFDCAVKKSFICELYKKHVCPVNVMDKLIRGVDGDDGYVNTKGVGSHKLYYQEPKTWNEARLACEADGAHLAIINNQEEANLFRQILPDSELKRYSGYKYGVWIGMHDKFQEGNWLDIFGQAVEFFNWGVWNQSQQPDNSYGNENCAGLFVDTLKPSVNVTMNDYRCEAVIGYFCEKY